MTNTHLLITARRAHEEAARIFAEVAVLRDASGAEYQAAADKLHRAGADYAEVAGIVDAATFYSVEDVRARLATWKPTDEEAWSDPDSADPHPEDQAPPRQAATLAPPGVRVEF